MTTPTIKDAVATVLGRAGIAVPSEPVRGALLYNGDVVVDDVKGQRHSTLSEAALEALAKLEHVGAPLLPGEVAIFGEPDVYAFGKVTLDGDVHVGRPKARP